MKTCEQQQIAYSVSLTGADAGARQFDLPWGLLPETYPNGKSYKVTAIKAGKGPRMKSDTVALRAWAKDSQ